MKKEITIKAIEFWALIIMMITLSITLAVNTIQTNKIDADSGAFLIIQARRRVGQILTA